MALLTAERVGSLFLPSPIAIGIAFCYWYCFERQKQLGFYAFPADSGSPESKDPIDSAFATVRPRIKAAKGTGSSGAGLATAYKLIEPAHVPWRPTIVGWVAFSDGHLGVGVDAHQQPRSMPPEHHCVKSVSASSGLAGVRTKAASTAAARQAPEPTSSATSRRRPR